MHTFYKIKRKFSKSKYGKQIIDSCAINIIEILKIFISCCSYHF